MTFTVCGGCGRKARPAPIATSGPAKGGGDPRHLLAVIEYVSSDYPGAVRYGRILSETEYAEQRALLEDARAMAVELPPRPGVNAAALVARIADAVLRMQEPEVVASRCQEARDAMVRAYDLVLTPSGPPSMARGAELFVHSCATCHGATGDGGGPDAARYSPRPASFHDAERMATLSPYRAFNVITYGAEGTAMASFDAYPEADRWNLAFYVFTLRHDDAAASRGASRYTAHPVVAATTERLAGVTDGEILAAARADGLGDRDASDLLAYLRRRGPYQGDLLAAGGFDVARRGVREALAAYVAGDAARARRLAVNAYLDGFEPREAALRAQSPALVERIERAFLELRASVDRGDDPSHVRGLAAQLGGLLDLAEEAGHAPLGSATTFLAALAILLREGGEAALVVAILLGLSRKRNAGRRAVRAIHAGWMLALLLGVATWWVAGRLLPASGRGREIAEGGIALFATLVLFSAGHVLLARRDAARRAGRLAGRAKDALAGGRVTFLGALAFLAVYREVFEVVIFLRALADDAAGHGGALALGSAAGMAALAALVTAFARFGGRLRPAPLLAASGALFCALAIVFAGQGVRSLQEAGVLGLAPAPLPRIPTLGVYPSWLTLLPQVVLLVILAASAVYVAIARRGQPPAGTGDVPGAARG